MLSFDQYPADFGKPTYSEEMHGNEAKPLVTVYAEAVVHADVLEGIRPGLRDALFTRPALNDSARLGDNGAVNDLVRRFTTMEPLCLTDEWPGYSLTVHGDLIDSAKEWSDVELGKLSIKPQDGGTARLKIRMQMRGEGLEWWVSMMNSAASITLEPPKAVPLPEGHPDARADDEGGQEQLPIGEGAPPEDDQFAGTDLATGSHSDGPMDKYLAERDGGQEAESPPAESKRRGRKPNGAAAGAPH